MHATTPPKENQLATRNAILAVARAKLAPLFKETADLDALPAWLWSLPACVIAKALTLDAAQFARELALKLDAETASRYPAERFVAYLAKHHPLLSHVQRARLAAFAQTLKEEQDRSFTGVFVAQMLDRGFTRAECDRLTPLAVKLIEAFTAEAEESEAQTGLLPADHLRAAGELAHTRRAYAEGDLELSAAATARVAPAQAGVAA